MQKTKTITNDVLAFKAYSSERIVIALHLFPWLSFSFIQSFNYLFIAFLGLLFMNIKYATKCVYFSIFFFCTRIERIAQEQKKNANKNLFVNSLTI